MHFVYSAVDLIDTSLISNRDLVPWRTDVHGTVVENLQRLYDTIQPQSWDRLRILYETTKGERRSGGGAAHPPLELRGELRALTPGAGPEEWLNDTDIGLALTGGAPGCLLNPYTKEEGLTVALTQNTSRGTRGVSSAVNDPTHRPFILLVGAPGHWKVLGIEPTQGRAYIFDSTGEPQNNLIRTLRAAIPKYKLIDVQRRIQEDGFNCGIHAIVFSYLWLALVDPKAILDRTFLPPNTPIIQRSGSERETLNKLHTCLSTYVTPGTDDACSPTNLRKFYTRKLTACPELPIRTQNPSTVHRGLNLPRPPAPLRGALNHPNPIPPNLPQPTAPALPKTAKTNRSRQKGNRRASRPPGVDNDATTAPSDGIREYSTSETLSIGMRVRVRHMGQTNRHLNGRIGTITGIGRRPHQQRKETHTCWNVRLDRPAMGPNAQGLTAPLPDSVPAPPREKRQYSYTFGSANLTPSTDIPSKRTPPTLPPTTQGQIQIPTDRAQETDRLAHLTGPTLSPVLVATVLLAATVMHATHDPIPQP